MKKKLQSQPDAASVLRQAALQKERVEEAVACKGTALECSSFKVSGKAFVFVGAKDARLKLEASLPEALALIQKYPGALKVGAHGWVTLTFEGGEALSPSVLEAWVEESYTLMSGKTAKTKPLSAISKRASGPK